MMHSHIQLYVNKWSTLPRIDSVGRSIALPTQTCQEKNIFGLTTVALKNGLPGAVRRVSKNEKEKVVWQYMSLCIKEGETHHGRKIHRSQKFTFFAL